ncbi:MAG: AmmeMemoRadiSam system radical SAM enzyme, partial [Thermoplasmata archaeon]
PHFKMTDRPPTPLDTLKKAFSIAKEEGLKYVYIGNVPHGDYENTYCPRCGALLIERYGFSSSIIDLDGNRCGKCGEKIPIVVE